MKSLFACLCWGCLLSLAALQSASAQPTPAAVSPATKRLPLEGQWQGPLPVPGGKLDVRIAITELANNAYFATLDVPQQRLSRVPMEVKVQGDTVTFSSAEVGCRFVSRRQPDGPKLVGQWEQPGYKTALILQYSPLPPPPKNFKFQPPYRIEEVTITVPADGVKLSGTLTTPAGQGPFPAVVLLSDMGPQTRDAAFADYNLFGGIADYLTRHRVAVLRFDDRGVGRSAGDSRLITTPLRVQDAQAALNFLRARPLLDVTRLGLLGHGEGANVALLAAAQPLPPAFVVSLAAAGVPGREHLAYQQALGRADGQPDTAQANETRRQELQLQDIRRQAEKMRASGANSAQVETFLAQQQMRQRSAQKKQIEANLKKQQTLIDVVRQTPDNTQARAILENMLRQFYPTMAAAQVLSTAEWMTTPWYRYYLDFNPLQGLAGVRCPVLLLHGTEDVQVNPAVNLAPLEKNLKGSISLTVKRLEGLNHQFQPPMADWPLVGGQSQPVFSPVALETIHDWILPTTQTAK
ncbi:alpha/beta hydrolase family protein [Hymenobacter guriensis]|uniref:Alpha/beta hydrolase n=1 Tax=Hymenobacter guriensis TaxID=2793065 RepID=A0ABS0L8K0_9BACT|nr:alpha/beta hydrolase [Hymenobacter guriensis]MBG8556401.1 alpha/beta hydrolase [Hymenobacter guriensis]